MPYRRPSHNAVVVADLNQLNDSGVRTGAETVGTPAGGTTQGSNIGGTPFRDWSYFAPDYSVSGNQISIETVAVGTENGVDYIDVRCWGTPVPVGNSSIGFTTAIVLIGTKKPPSGLGQGWTLSANMKLVASPGGLPPTFGLFIDEFDANGGYLGQHGSNTTLSTTTPLDQQRYVLQCVTGIFPAAGQGIQSGSQTIAEVNPIVAISYSNGSPAFDFTFRIGGVRLEAGTGRHMHQRRRLVV